MDILMTIVPVVMLAGILLLPFWMLANETYKAVYKVDKVPAAAMLLHFIPFYNYCMVRKYLYGRALPSLIMSCLAVLLVCVRVVCYIVAPTNILLMLYTSFVAMAGICMWYITMGFTSFYTSRLTRRGWITTILGTLLPPLGAYIVSKNIRACMKQSLEVNSEFRPDNYGA